tara:strand:+ start:4511 stop:7210 length:2700 start_codon:yes stop_codon:yes gene_type:complete
MSKNINIDLDNNETKEWEQSLEDVILTDGKERANFLISDLVKKYDIDSNLVNTRYTNTISTKEQVSYPGNLELERVIRSYTRWNAMAMVLRAGNKAPGVGGHIASFASSATLYDVGFNHFFKRQSDKSFGDLVYIQGHTSPGIYARSFLEGRFDQKLLDNFRQEVGQTGLSSYPHPYLMPDYWQFPTVSMGLGPIQAIYQARFLKYLHNRGLQDTSDRKVWCFCGDGEMDEPESLGALNIAVKEKLDNLIFVINCNLQRLDGPVRGNSKVIQELEGIFKGSGWNAIKVLWGGRWDPLFEKDKNEFIVKRCDEVVDGDFQNYKARGGAFTRENFFGKYPEMKALVADLSDQEIWNLNRGGHDPEKVYNAYLKASTNTNGKPTVILAKTVKGFGMGLGSGEAENITHQKKKMDFKALSKFRERFSLPIDDKKLENLEYIQFDKSSKEYQYLMDTRKKLGGFFPWRREEESKKLQIPEFDILKNITKGSGGREISTTMAFTRIFSDLLKDKNIKQNLVPIVPDEARTFGMEGLFRQIGIYSPEEQKYAPEDQEQLMSYHESTKGQLLEEGITEAGAFSSWMAAAASYSNNDLPMVPFYIFYSMFGMQRIGDLAWAAGDLRARGFLLGATAGRTTLAGEGLQHCDGNSHTFSSLIPNCKSYDPTFSYELAAIIHKGLKSMYQDCNSEYYYITVMNDNYEHPDMGSISDNKEELYNQINQGLYLFSKSDTKSNKKLNNKVKVSLLSSGPIFLEAMKAKEMLESEHNVSVDLWSATSFTELAREAQIKDRWNMLHPDDSPKVPYVTKCLLDSKDTPFIAVTDYAKSYTNQIREFVPGHYKVLGTDGFGRSDTRDKLRHFFEVDSKHIVIAALKSLCDQKLLDKKELSEAFKKYKINQDKEDPTLC